MTARPVTPIGILARELHELIDLVKEEDLRVRLQNAHTLAAGLDPYLEACTTPESPALRALAQATAAHDWTRHDGVVPVEQEMLSGHVEGQLLKMLVHVTRARRVLDIGMFTGYSALAMAEALAEAEAPAQAEALTEAQAPAQAEALTEAQAPAQAEAEAAARAAGRGEVVACEVDPGVAAFARRHFAAAQEKNRITVEVGPAAATLAKLADAGRTFDLVFIDADKAGYRSYVDLVLTRGLLTAYGLIVVDNTLMQGRPWGAGPPSANGAAIAAFNAQLAADPRVEQVLIPLRDGVTLIRRRSGR